MNARRYKTAEFILPHTLVWQDARKAMQSAGFIPLVCLGNAEHWVRDNKRVILYVDADKNASECITDQTMLHATAHVEFQAIGDVLVALI